MVVDTYFNQIKETTNQSINEILPVLNKMVFENENKKAKIMLRKTEPWNKRYNGGRIKLKCKNGGEMISNHHYSWHMEVCKQFFMHIRKIGKENWQCKICSKEVKKRISLYVHLRKKHPEENCQNKIANMNLNFVIKETKNQSIKGAYEETVTNTMLFENKNKNIEITSRNDEHCNKMYNGGRIKSKCKNCNKWISDHHFASHMEVCEQFFRHIRKIGSLYQCKICSNKVRKRAYLYVHLRKKHPKEICQNKNANMNLKIVQTKCLESTTPKVQNVNHSNVQNKGINITEIPMKSEENWFQSSRNGKKGKYCVHCKIEFSKKFSDESMKKHTLDCKAYSKLMCKVTNGYQCLVCSVQIRNEKIIILRRKMLGHIKYWHKSELLNQSKKKESTKISMNHPVNSSTKG